MDTTEFATSGNAGLEGSILFMQNYTSTGHIITHRASASQTQMIFYRSMNL